MSFLRAKQPLTFPTKHVYFFTDDFIDQSNSPTLSPLTKRALISIFISLKPQLWFLFQSSTSTMQISPLMEETISSTSNSSIISSSDDNRRCCKKSKMADTDDDKDDDDKDDKISRLPEEILCKILSALSTKETVRTSILSKQWRYVWTSVPNLVLNDSEFLCNKRRDSVEIRNCFVNFMNRVLHLHNFSSIQKFYLYTADYYYDLSNVNAWINTAISRNVEEIDMDVSLTGEDHVELPCSFFTSKKLVGLKLGSSFVLNVPKSVNFPNLKIVHLHRVKFADENSVKNFFSGCPVLEELFIIKCARENVKTLYIQSSTLKNLTVTLDDTRRRDFEYRLLIESPNLQYLDLTNCVTEDCSVNFLSSLVMVNLSVTNYPLVIKDEFNSRFIKLFRNISKAKHLELCPVKLDFSRYPDFGNLPMFLNLTYLKVVVSDYRFDFLPSLLELSPSLHIFDIGKRVDYYSLCDCRWESPYCIPKCLLLCLEEIVIKEYEACDNEIEMVEYFLKNGRVLKKMLIEFEFIKLDRKVKSYVRKKLLAFPKASSSCKISFS